MKELPRPTREQVEKIADTLYRRFQPHHDEIRHWRDLRWRKANVMFGDGQNAGIPEAYRRTTVEVRTPIIQYNGQEAKALLLANPPLAMVKTRAQDKQSTCTLAERFCNGSYARLEEATAADAKVADTQIHYGAGIIKTFPRRQPWPDYPSKDVGESDEDWNERTENYKKGQSLLASFEYQHIPPDTFSYLEDSQGLAAAMEFKKVNEWELMQQFGLTRTGDGEYIKSETGADETQYDPLREAEVIEYWNRQWRVLLVKGGRNGTELDVWEHKFGRVPYFIAGAYETGETDPARQYIPLLWALYPEAEENNRLHTMRTNVAYFTGFPFYYVYTAATGEVVLDETTGQPKVFVMEPGKHPQLNPGQEFRQLSLTSGFDLQAALAASDERMKQYALPPVASGKAPSSESAGWNTAMLRRFLVSLLDPLLRGRSQQRAAICRFWLTSIQHHIGETVYVNADVVKDGKVIGREAVGVAPKEVEELGDFDLVVQVNANLQMDRIPQEAHGWGLVKEGARSMQTFLEQDCGIDAPEEELERIDTDRAANALFDLMMQKLIAWMETTGAADQVLGGAAPEAVVRGMEQTENALGKGSPMQPRTPGLRMPAAMPIGESPTYTPAEAPFVQ